MKKIFYSFILFILCNAFVYSQILSGKVTESQLGFSFVIPENWQGTKSQKGYLLISKTQKGFLLITPHNFNNIEEIEQNANEGINSGTGSILTLTSKLSRTNNNGVAGTFKGILNGQSTIAYVISLLSPHGGGVSIFAFVNAQNYSDDYEDIVKTISNSVVFSDPKLENSVAEGWKLALNNCRLIHLNNDNAGDSGTKSKITIDLCEKGYFNYKNESEVSTYRGNVDGHSAGSRVGAGEWKIIDRVDHAELQLIFNNGDIKDYLLSIEHEKIFLNGEQYIKTYKNSTIKEAQPDCF